MNGVWLVLAEKRWKILGSLKQEYDEWLPNIEMVLLLARSDYSLMF
jgi:hypothetical protein